MIQNLCVQRMDGDNVVDQYRLDSGQKIVKIGRLPSNQIQLSDPSVARIHAIINVGPADATLVDLGSPSGTLVNGQRQSRAILRTGDRIQIGKTVLVLAELPNPESVQLLNHLATAFKPEFTPAPHNPATTAFAPSTSSPWGKPDLTPAPPSSHPVEKTPLPTMSPLAAQTGQSQDQDPSSFENLSAWEQVLITKIRSLTPLGAEHVESYVEQLAAAEAAPPSAPDHSDETGTKVVGKDATEPEDIIAWFHEEQKQKRRRIVITASVGGVLALVLVFGLPRLLTSSQDNHPSAEAQVVSPAPTPSPSPEEEFTENAQAAGDDGTQKENSGTQTAQAAATPAAPQPANTPNNDAPVAAKTAEPIQQGEVQSPDPAPTPAAPAQEKTHIVKAGETLGVIAKQHYGDPRKYTVIYEANTDVLTDPSAVEVGMTLRIP